MLLWTSGYHGELLWTSGYQSELLWTSWRAAMGFLGFLQPFLSSLSMRSHTANRSSAAGETSDGPPTIE
nr:hypothetical protein [Prevotella sp.]